MTDTKEKLSKKKKILILLAILAASLLLLAAVFYLWKANYYKTHFLPNTYINDADCSELNVDAVADVLKADAASYTLKVLGRDATGEQAALGTVTAEQIMLEVTDAKRVAEELLNLQNPYQWILPVLTKQVQSYDTLYGVSFDETALKKCVMKFEAFQTDNMTAPQDAYISEYKEALKGCEIIPEVEGTQIDTNAAVLSICSAITGGAEKVDLEEHGCYALPEITATDEKLIEEWKIRNQWLGTEITYDWNTSEVVVDGSIVQEWIVKEEDGSLSLDESAVAAFVAEKASKYDTYGKSRKFTTTLGVELTLPTGGFGWKTDRTAVTEELVKMIKNGTVDKAEPVYSNTAPVHGTNDIGNSYVEVDLSNQHLYLYSKGQLVFETDFVSGSMSSTPDCVTPAGVFDITYKTKNAVLKGATYQTPVSYWMPFYGNYGMHDATWRWQFGGDIFLTNGSHGCINLPLDSAAVIYNYVYEGFPVICYYY